MSRLDHLLTNNRAWAASMTGRDPDFFDRLAHTQKPQYLWIGCSDSRVPANEIVGLLPGELFVHRNVANVVVHTDLNCLSVLQFAVDVLQVEHVIVCGHYGCGGVRAAWRTRARADRQLAAPRPGRAATSHEPLIRQAVDEEARQARLCELNVIEQVATSASTTIVQDAWRRGQPLHVHGWIYGLEDGLLRDLGMTVMGSNDLSVRHDAAVANALRPRGAPLPPGPGP